MAKLCFSLLSFFIVNAATLVAGFTALSKLILRDFYGFIYLKCVPSLVCRPLLCFIPVAFFASVFFTKGMNFEPTHLSELD